jgi:hypothetical protein
MEKNLKRVKMPVFGYPGSGNGKGLGHFSLDHLLKSCVEVIKPLE